MQIRIDKPSHFCLFDGSEVGIAVNKEAANRFRDNMSEDWKMISPTQEFGWIDQNGDYYIDNKHDMSRPSEQQVIEALKRHSELFRIAQEKQLITIINKTSEKTLSRAVTHPTGE